MGGIWYNDKRITKGSNEISTTAAPQNLTGLPQQQKGVSIMGFNESFEAAKNFAVNAAQTAVQKAKVLAAIAKTNVSIYAEEDKIRKAEAQLGKLYYRDYAVGEEMDSAEYLPWCQKIDESKKLIEESMNEVEVGNKVTKETNDAMQEVMAELDQIIQEVANIRTASDKQAVSVKNIKKGVGDINDVIQSNSAAAEETSATSEELSASATTLNELLEHFKLRG